MRSPAARVAIASFSALAAIAGAGAVSSHAATSSRPTFSTPTIIDPFREGFEPDISLDPHSGAIYSSVPNGTPGTSTLWRSDDGGRQWRVVEGNTAGEPSHCPPIAGGDTELAVDPVNGGLYYADLQPLTNFNASVSNDQGRTWLCNATSVPDTGVDRQWYAIDSNGGTNAVTNGGIMYFDYDDTTQSPTQPTGNVLVVNASNNGLAFGSVCEQNAACAGPSARITLNEGLPGNLVVDDNAGSPHQHTVYALHTSADVGGVVLTKCTGAASGIPASAPAAANYCLDPTAATAPYGISSHWSDHWVYQTDVNGVASHIEANNFATLAIDSAGNLYALWVDYPGTISTTDPVQSSDTYTGPGRLLLSYSANGGDTWSTPQQISDPSLKNDAQPWLTAGSPGRVAVAWYGATQQFAPDGVTQGPDALTNGVWNVYVAENLDVLHGGTWTTQVVSDHPAHLGAVSTEGLQLPSGPDRSLGDFMKISHDANGAIQLAYVDDNTELYQALQDYGPVVAVHQTGGPSLIAGKTVPTTNESYTQGFVTQKPGTAMAHFAGQDIAGPPHLDITGASVSLLDASDLKVTLTVNDPNLASDLGPDTAIGGGTADDWMVRWDYDPAKLPANLTPGAFYVGMQNSASGGLSFFDGAVATTPNPVTNPTLYTFAYPGGHAVQNAKISGNTITWIVPTADVGNPHSGDTLYEVQAMTATEAVPAHGSGDPTSPVPFFGGLGLYNQGDSVVAPTLVDQSASFDAPLAVGPVANTPETPAAAVLVIAGLAVAGGATGLRRRRRAGYSSPIR